MTHDTQVLTFESRLVATDEEKATYLALHNAYVPDRAMTQAEMDKRDSTFPADKKKLRELLFRDGTAVAGTVLFEAYWKAEPGRYDFFMLYDAIDTTTADAIAAKLEGQVREFGGTNISTWVYDTRIEEIAAYESRGYRCVQKNAQSELDLTNFDPTPFMGAVESLDQSELTCVDLTQLAAMYPDAWKRMYWQAEWDMLADVPLPFELKQDPFERWEKEFEAYREDWPWTLAVLDGDRIVSMSMLFESKFNPERFFTGLTATLPDYRRRGIATAIKVKNLMRAKAAGGKVVGTDNEGNNPMLDLNKQLGFGVVYHLCGYERDL